MNKVYFEFVNVRCVKLLFNVYLIYPSFPVFNCRLPYPLHDKSFCCGCFYLALRLGRSIGMRY